MFQCAVDSWVRLVTLVLGDRSIDQCTARQNTSQGKLFFLFTFPSTLNLYVSVVKDFLFAAVCLQVNMTEVPVML